MGTTTALSFGAMLQADRNREIYRGDCLDVIQEPTHSFGPDMVDLVYLDPPFNSQASYNLPFDPSRAADLEAIEAFDDCWEWNNACEDSLKALEATGSRQDAVFIDYCRNLLAEHRLRLQCVAAMPAYLLFMYKRLCAIKELLKPTGTVVVHCDQHTSHHLRRLMDMIWGAKLFRNQVSWGYNTLSAAKRHFPRKHDDLLIYAASDKAVFYPDQVRVPYAPQTMNRRRYSEGRKGGKGFMAGQSEGRDEATVQAQFGAGKIPPDWWHDIPTASESERIGYPTQKPIELLKRIILAFTQPDDLVFDPFAGGGTTLVAAEELGRRWIGIDVSRYSAAVMRARILEDFEPAISPSDITIHGIPTTANEVKAVAKQNPRGRTEAEQLVCVKLGAFHSGKRSGDGGIDGYFRFKPMRTTASRMPQSDDAASLAVVQIKSGNVTADQVRAMTQVRLNFNAEAAIFVCFEDHKQTALRHRDPMLIPDILDDYNRVQVITIEDIYAPHFQRDFLPNVERHTVRSKSFALPDPDSYAEAHQGQERLAFDLEDAGGVSALPLEL